MTENAPGSAHPDEAGGSPNFETMTAEEVMTLIEEALTHLEVEHLTRIIKLVDERRREKEDETRSRLLQRWREEASAAGLSLDTLLVHVQARYCASGGRREQR
jgi:hypothetical protein